MRGATAVWGRGIPPGLILPESLVRAQSPLLRQVSHLLVSPRKSRDLALLFVSRGPNGFGLSAIWMLYPQDHIFVPVSYSGHFLFIDLPLPLAHSGCVAWRLGQHLSPLPRGRLTSLQHESFLVQGERPKEVTGEGA